MEPGPGPVPSETARPGYPIGSVDNALRLLLAFRDHPRLRLSDASSYLGVAHSTAHRLLAMLAYHGFVQKEESTRAYVAGPALVEVGLAVVNRMDIRAIAHPVLVDLQEQFQETVHLAVLEGSQVRYIDCIESERTLRVATRIGTLLPAHCTSVGKALLARLPPSAVNELYEEADLPRMTKNSISEFAVLERELARVRNDGYATNHGESEEGVTSVAVAVMNPIGQPVAALSVAAPVNRTTPDQMKEMAIALRDCATRVAELLPN